MFTLWIKPGQILTNQLEKNERSTGATRLVQIPSSYCSIVPHYLISVGSEVYGLSQHNDPSSNMFVRNKEDLFWCNAPIMTVARAKAIGHAYNGKLYVMGGCRDDESVNWGEVFDPKTQTWEALPDPGSELRFSSIRKIDVFQEKLYVRSNEKIDSVYDPKEGKWNVAEKSPVQCLDMLNRNLGSGMIEIANYGGKLLILWDKVGLSQDKDICCAVIALEKRDGVDEVWGKIEWASIVLTVPSSYVFLYSLLNRI
ncbi:Kelch-type beta propeller [Arabidopsis suecica]|uniref:Kelch-type beta propeller n=1 Tax=Arabidopsis suecica TaxID=45249 RepID=A0A8T2DMI8_ARASU|nr:Kelch-type beta propeller [Arabidopsis suecica]